MKLRSVVWFVIAVAMAAAVPACTVSGRGGGGEGSPESVPLTQPPQPRSQMQSTGPADYIDRSAVAVQAFDSEWRYEVIVPSDLNGGLDQALEAGHTTCILIHQDLDSEAVVRTIGRTYGYSYTGAQAVVAAALRKLCTTLNRGYLTRWDGIVGRAQDLIQQDWGPRPTYRTTGAAVRQVCDYLSAHQGNSRGLGDLLTTEGTPRDAYGRFAPINSTVRAAVRAHCVNFLDVISQFP